MSRRKDVLYINMNLASYKGLKVLILDKLRGVIHTGNCWDNLAL
jgi:hypothetical protein